MALELLHRCRLRNQNDGAAGGNVQIKGGNIIMRSLCHVTKGAKSNALVFFSDACRKRLTKTKLLG